MAINNSSLIHKAVENCNIKDLQYLLDNGKENIDVADEFMRTPLHLAVLGRFEQGVTLLLKRGAQINIGDARQQTPLHWSCLVKSKHMVSALLEKGAEINCMDKIGRSPLHEAVIRNFQEGVELLLLTRGADLNTHDSLGDTPLHDPVINGNLQMVEMLINNGAKLNLKNDHDKTALHIAAFYRRPVVRSLLLYGAEVDVQDYNGCTPLHLILKNLSYEDILDCNDSNIVEDLLDWGASLIIRDKNGDTPLTLAAKQSVPVYGLIKNGDTPLTLAAKQSVPVYSLIKHHIKLQCVDLQLAYKTSYMGSTYTLGRYKTFCANELAKLTTTIFDNQSVRDVFSKYKDPTFLSNCKMREAIYSSDFETEFPLYTVLLRAMFRHAEKRVPLLDIAQGVFIHLIGEHLPPEISRKIISNLSNEDILNFTTAGNCI